MASRINDNIRAEWDSIDFDDSDSKNDLANSPTKELVGNRVGVSKVKGNAKTSSASDQKARKSPVRRHQSKRSGSDQEHTGLTQDCITLEPRVSIQAKYSWLDNEDPAYPKLPTRDRGQKYRRDALPTVDGTLDQNPDESTDQSSVEESDQEIAIDDRKVVSSVDETEDNLSDDDETDPGSPITDAPKGIRLPNDSDDEEFKAAKERRVRAYAKNSRLNDSQGSTYDEKAQKQTPISGRQDNPINLISSITPSTPTDQGYSQRSSMLPPVQTKASNNNTAKKQQSPLKGNQIPIPVSSSTEPSQDSRSSKHEDVQAQRTSSLTAMAKIESHINLISYPSLPSTTSPGISGESRLSSQANLSSAVLSTSPQKANTPVFHTNASPRKHPRSSQELSKEISSSPRKRQRLDSPAAIPLKQEETRSTKTATTPDFHASQSKSSSLQRQSPQIPLKPLPIPLVNAGMSSQMQHLPASPRYSIPAKPRNTIQVHIRSGEDVNFNPLRHISASQPVPERSRTHQVLQATTNEPPTQMKASLFDLAREAEAASKQIPEPSRPMKSSPVELNLEPLVEILSLRSTNYQMAVQNDRVYNGLQSLFCEFLTTHLTYLGNMEHLFNLCIWLLRCVMNPNQQKGIDEEFWDDFIIQHQQGKYNAYVQRCLAKFREPGSWTIWYQQAQRNKLSTRVVTSARLQDILMGRGHTTPKRNIPLLWSRFMNANRGKMKGIVE